MKWEVGLYTWTLQISSQVNNIILICNEQHKIHANEQHSYRPCSQRLIKLYWHNFFQYRLVMLYGKQEHNLFYRHPTSNHCKHWADSSMNKRDYCQSRYHLQGVCSKNVTSQNTGRAMASLRHNTLSMQPRTSSHLFKIANYWYITHKLFRRPFHICRQYRLNA